MPSVEQLLAATKNGRKDLILGAAGNLDLEEDAERSRGLARVLNMFIPEYLDAKRDKDLRNPGGSILETTNFMDAAAEIVNRYKRTIEGELRQEGLPSREEGERLRRNIYELSGANKLTFANHVTRKINTKMGFLFEELAQISPHAISPKQEFDISIKGIDLIARNVHTGVIEYQQMKTQKNTLTGSQKTRSVLELQNHSNPVFCVCLDTGRSWTFNDPDIPRVSGGEYWSRIGISYDLVLTNIKSLVRDLEPVFVDMLTAE